MESRPQNPEFRNNPENLHPCFYMVQALKALDETEWMCSLT